jgi:hypothetical protein
VDDLIGRLNIDPGREGMNAFTAGISSKGKPVADASNVSLEFSSLPGMMASSNAVMTNQRDGIYTLH